MPITYTVERDGKYVNAIATGILTTDEVCEYVKQVETDDRIKEGFVELFDVNRITESELDKNGLERIAEQVKESKMRLTGSRLAIVVARGDSFDRAQYFERLAADTQNVIMFNSRDIAEQWLGV